MDVATFDPANPTVAVVGRDAVAAAADLAGPTDVAALPDIATLRAVLDAASSSPLDAARPDCVVATGAIPDGSVAELASATAAADPDLPVVFAPAEPDPAAASAIAGASAVRYLPRSLADDGDLAAAVRDAAAACARRRQASFERGLFREVMADAPLSIYLKDEAVRHVAVSSEADLAIDDSPIGKTDRELFGDANDGAGDADQVPESYEDDLSVVESGEPIEDREEVVHLDCSKDLWLRTTKRPRRNEDGDVVGVLGVTRDVSAEKRRERELRSETRRLEQFASFASHDLRNPLTIARGYLDGVRADRDDERLGAVAAELDRMEALIEDLLQIARPSEEHDEAWVNVRSVVRRAWDALDAADADLTVSVPDDLEVRAARGALRQLLENVLGNALEHAGPDVAVEVGLTDTGFYVADDGPGLPEDERDRVFDYGFTTDGTGVGLAIAAEIADAHGWEPRAGASESGGALLAFDRTLRRRADAPSPPEGEEIDLGEWTTVGDLAVEGGASDDGDGAWTIRGGGEALWGGIEEYATLPTTVDGDVRIEGRLRSVEQVHEYSKAGLLLADALEPDRPLGFVGMTAGHGTEAAWRAEPAGLVDTHQAEPDAKLPRWYRIDRLGDRVTFWASADGEDWTMVDQHVLPLSASVAVGLAVNGHEPGSLCEAAFEGVRVVELRPGDGSGGRGSA